MSNRSATKSPLRPIRVMLSSRNVDKIPDGSSAVQLLEVRKELQKDLQDERFLDRQLLEVWINENGGAESGDRTALETCLNEVAMADILIVIYNGAAGWSPEAGGIGICHSEFQYAQDRQPGKVYVIKMKFATDKKLGLVSPEELAKANAQNKGFSESLNSAGSFVSFAIDRDSLKSAVRDVVVKAIRKFVVLAKKELGKGRLDSGESLQWSRLSYDERQEKIQAASLDFFSTSGATIEGNTAHHELGGDQILFCVHAVPSKFSIAEARERVGRPFLRDHEIIAGRKMKDAIGPIHIVACHKGCTESQVISFIGHPDLFLVEPPFGFYTLERVSFVQTFFITDCWNDASVKSGLQGLFEWLRREGEEKNVVARARSRAKILEAISREVNGMSDKSEKP